MQLHFQTLILKKRNVRQTRILEILSPISNPPNPNYPHKTKLINHNKNKMENKKNPKQYKYLSIYKVKKTNNIQTMKNNLLLNQPNQNTKQKMNIMKIVFPHKQDHKEFNKTVQIIPKNLYNLQK